MQWLQDDVDLGSRRCKSGEASGPVVTCGKITTASNEQCSRVENPSNFQLQCDLKLRSNRVKSREAPGGYEIQVTSEPQSLSSTARILGLERDESYTNPITNNITVGMEYSRL